MEIGDKLLEKIEENHGKGVTKLMTGLVVSAIMVVCVGIILKGVELFFLDIVMPIYLFVRSFDYLKLFKLAVTKDNSDPISVTLFGSKLFFIETVTSIYNLAVIICCYFSSLGFISRCIVDIRRKIRVV